MPISFRFFLAEMLPVKFLTTSYVEEETIHAAPSVHGSYQQCTMRGHLCEETQAWISGRGLVEKITSVHATPCWQAQTWHEPCGSQQNAQQ
jgi:hypothetical protein